MHFKFDDVLVFTLISIAIVAVIAYFMVVAIGKMVDRIVDYCKKIHQEKQENAESNKNGIE